MTTQLSLLDRDWINRKFGRMTVVAVVRTGKELHFECVCACGAKKLCRKGHIIHGRIKSCGCYRRDITMKHGMFRSSEYQSWQAMKERCHNPNSTSFHKYGGRGISVCKRWQNSFENFFKDMGPKPSSLHSINRKNNDGDYTPGNCEWADLITQANNTRTNRVITARGRTMTVAQWSRFSGINCNTIRHRLFDGWSERKAVTVAVWRIKT